MKRLLMTILVVIIVSSVVFTGCAKKQATTAPNSLDSNVGQGINEVEDLNENLTDPQLDSDIANVENTLNNW